MWPTLHRERKRGVPTSLLTDRAGFWNLLLITAYWTTQSELPEKSTAPFSSAQLGISEKTQVISNAVGIPNSTKAVHTIRWASPLSNVKNRYKHCYYISIQACESCLSSKPILHGCCQSLCISSVSWLRAPRTQIPFPIPSSLSFSWIFFFIPRIHIVSWEAGCHRAS